MLFAAKSLAGELVLRIASGQIRGKRDTQEDRALLAFGGKFIEAGEDGIVSLATANSVTAVLCDGMGGHEAGEVAAKLASEEFMRQALRAGSVDLKSALEAANDAIAREIRKNSSRKGMGTTLVGAQVADRQLNWVSCGDSLLLLCRNGKISRLNQDHSMKSVYVRMVQQGMMTEEAARNQPQRNALMSALSGDEITLIDSGAISVALRRNDIVLLCSDGIDDLPLANLQHRIFSRNDIRQRISGLLDDVVALGNSQQDNLTIAAIAVME